jgi:hypothetical protein
MSNFLKSITVSRNVIVMGIGVTWQSGLLRLLRQLCVGADYRWT